MQDLLYNYLDLRNNNDISLIPNVANVDNLLCSSYFNEAFKKYETANVYSVITCL